MVNILYIHGYNGSPNGGTARRLAAYDPRKYNVVAIDYEYDKPLEALKKIKKHMDKGDIDMLIGTSLGGFLVMNCFGYPRMAINPCMLPSVELPKIGYKGPTDEYEKLEKSINSKVDAEESILCCGCLAPDDELLGTKYIGPFTRLFKYAGPIRGGHTPNDAAIEDILGNYLPTFMDKLKKINESIDGADNREFYD